MASPFVAVQLLQLEQDPQSRIDLPKFVEAEAPDDVAKASGVHGGGLLDQDASRRSIDEDLWAEARGSG